MILQTRPVADRLRVREIDDVEGRQLVRIVRRGCGSVVTWRRAQMVLLLVQGHGRSSGNPQMTRPDQPSRSQMSVASGADAIAVIWLIIVF